MDDILSFSPTFVWQCLLKAFHNNQAVFSICCFVQVCCIWVHTLLFQKLEQVRPLQFPKTSSSQYSFQLLKGQSLQACLHFHLVSKSDYPTKSSSDLLFEFRIS